MNRNRRAAATVLGVSALLAGAMALPANAAPVGTTVLSGLGGPLHLTSSAGALYVADTFSGRVIKAPDSGGTQVIGPPFNVSAVSASPGGTLFGVIGEGDGAMPSLVRVTASGPQQVVDLLAFEKAHNPDGQPQQTGPRADALSNPYDVLALGDRTLIADAAANDIISVDRSGTPTLVTALPVSKKGDCATATNNGVRNGGCDPVPTGLALGSDGFLYVSGLGAEVEGHVWKIDLSSNQIVAQWDGLPPLTGIATGGQGSVYVSSLFANVILRLGKDGRPLGAAEVSGPTDITIHDGVMYAGSVAFGPNGPGGGSVVKLGLSRFFRR